VSLAGRQLLVQCVAVDTLAVGWPHSEAFVAVDTLAVGWPHSEAWFVAERNDAFASNTVHAVVGSVVGSPGQLAWHQVCNWTATELALVRLQQVLAACCAAAGTGTLQGLQVS